MENAAGTERHPRVVATHEPTLSCRLSDVSSQRNDLFHAWHSNCGIADGRGLAAALMLGAVGVSMGTRFVASHEWSGGSWEQTPLLAASTDDTIRTDVYDQIRGAEFPSGIADRVIRNAFNSKWEKRSNEIESVRNELQHELELAASQGDSGVMDISGGEAVGLVHRLESARTIVDRIVDEAARLLRDNASKYVDPTG